MLFELNNIHLHQGNFELQIPHLGLESGQLYVLQGENGSGKSTLLRLMALLQPPQAGTVSFAGCRVNWQKNELNRLRRNITLLEQTPLLFSGSVEKNLAFGLKIRGIHGKELHREIDQSLAIVGLSGFQKRPAKELSGGESRRVALARAICLKPRLLLLDEPTANLDSTQIGSLEKFLCELPRQEMTLVITNHDGAQLERLGGTLLSIKNGQLAEQPRQALSQPRLKVV